MAFYDRILVSLSWPTLWWEDMGNQWGGDQVEIQGGDRLEPYVLVEIGDAVRASGGDHVGVIIC